MKCLNMLTDQQLIHLYMEGDTNAFAAILQRYKNKIYTSIFLLVKDRYLAEDIFQDVFIRIIEKLKAGSYTHEGKFLPWTLRVAHNMCMDHFRKVKRMPTITTGDGCIFLKEPEHTVPGADSSILKNESRDRVGKMLDMLSEDQRDVIILRHYAGLSFKEIADLMHCSINTALGRMRYGLLNLRSMAAEKQISL